MVAAAQDETFRDRDWNTTLVTSCGMPQASSVQTVQRGGDRKLRVTLAPGDQGKCRTDGQKRHRAPYWERAELTADRRLPLGTHHRIRAEVTFEQGFLGEREAFFQIHGWARDCTSAYPPVMMKFEGGLLRVETLRRVAAMSSGRHRNTLRQRVDVRRLYGQSLDLVLEFDSTTRPGKLSVSLDGTQIVSGAPVDYAACAKPYVKLGVYRPGGKGSATSIVVFDDIRIEALPR